MMVNHMDGTDGYGEIILDSTEPFAKMILKCFASKCSLDILEVTDDPITVNDISAGSGYTKARVYRQIHDLLNSSMLVAVGREKDQRHHGRVSSRLYERSFYALA